MAIVHTTGISSVSPHTGLKRILISYSGYDSVELLCCSGGSPGYQLDWTELLRSDGRTRTGAVRVVGNNLRNVRSLQVASDATHDQIEYLRLLKFVSDKDNTPVSVSDYFYKVVYDSSTMTAPTWLSGYPVTENSRSTGFIAYNAFLDLGEGFANATSPGRLYEVTFTLQILV